jgi:hypothetical protein
MIKFVMVQYSKSFIILKKLIRCLRKLEGSKLIEDTMRAEREKRPSINKFRGMQLTPYLRRVSSNESHPGTSNNLSAF